MSDVSELSELLSWFEGLPPGVELLVPKDSPSETGVVTNPMRFVASIRVDVTRPAKEPSLQSRLRSLRAILEGRAGPPVVRKSTWSIVPHRGES